jgi:hypothetical protein
MKRSTRVSSRHSISLSTLMALLTLLLLAGAVEPARAQSQWTTNGNDINNTNTGNVGVGTSAPAHKLDVNGNIYGTNLFSSKRVFRDASSNSGAPAIWYKIATLPVTGNPTGDLLDLRITGGRYDSINKFEMGVKMGNRNGFNAYVFSAAGQVTERLYSRVVAYNNGGAVDVYLYLPGNGGFASYSSIGVEMTATGWGTGPTLYPTSSGVTTTPPGTLVFDSSTAAVPLTINNSGSVGIGTTSPTSRLQVGGQADNLFQVVSTGSATTDTVANFASAVGNIMTVRGSGNVGVGTSAPAHRLDVAGNVNSSALCIAGDCKTAWSQVGGSSQWTTSGSNIFYNAGNVGIGTSNTANAKLTVADSGATPIRVDGSAVNSGLLLNNTSAGGKAWVLYSSGSGAGAVSNGGLTIRNGTEDVNVLTALPGGNVGIGTTSPNAKFVVASGNFGLGTNSLAPWTAQTSVIESSDTSLFFGLDTDIGFNSNAYHSGGWKYKTADLASNIHLYKGDIYFRTAPAGAADAPLTWTNAMFISSGGKVGIGTTAPTQKLHVSGGNVFHQYSATAGQEYGFYTSISNNHVASNLFFDGQWKMLTAGKGATTMTGPFSDLAFAVYADNTSRAAGSLASLNQLFQVNMNGNVGVGTAAPAHKLDVAGNVNAAGLCIAGDCKTAWSQVGGGSPSQWTTSGSNIYYNTGNVGIGTASPTSAKLVIGGSPGAEGLDLATSDQYANLRVIRNSNSGFDKDLFLQYGAGAGSKIHFYSNNSESMTLSAGNLGIGTTSPSVKLDVVGDVNASGTITGGNIVAKYQDVAEWVPVREQMSAGTVVVLDTEQSNQVTTSKQPYDTRVAGVVSAQPGVILGEAGENKAMIATTGRVKVKVDATRAPIKIGDLLVTSDVPGVAMKSIPLDLGGTPIHRPGTIIGKALEPLAKGVGEILVLLSLQ